VAGRNAGGCKTFERTVLEDATAERVEQTLPDPMAAAAAAASNGGSETMTNDAPPFLGDEGTDPGDTGLPHGSGGTCKALGVRGGVGGIIACGELSQLGDNMTI